MSLWLAFTALTVAALAALGWPLLRARGPAASDVEAQRAVFRDQLDEVERDAARGLISAEEAKAARNEVARRLIATENAEAASGDPPRRASLAPLALVPVIAVPVYLHYGAPTLPDMPLQTRLEQAIEQKDFVALVAKVEQQLAKNPNDAEGWRVLVPAYREMGRFAEAASALQQLLRLEPPTAPRLADFGEMQVLANEGMVTANAAKAFAAALAADPKLPKARFFTALALKQEGKREEAVAEWRALLADSAPDAPWAEAVKTQIADTTGQNDMILSMVNGLEERLKTENQDLDGWLKLIRSRVVLGERERAKAAYASARDIFKDRPEALAALAGLARELRIE
jgi:cytochrome c-type biogenesis protein CcmH